MDIVPDLASLLIKDIPELKIHLVMKTEAQDPCFLDLMDRIRKLKLENVVRIDNTFYNGDEKVKVINSWHMATAAYFTPSA
jgi:hypothetical protein